MTSSLAVRLPGRVAVPPEQPPTPPFRCSTSASSPPVPDQQGDDYDDDEHHRVVNREVHAGTVRLVEAREVGVSAGAWDGAPWLGRPTVGSEAQLRQRDPLKIVSP